MSTTLARQELKICKSEDLSNCTLSAKRVDELAGNPAGTGKSDEANPFYKGKVVYASGQLTINLSYTLTGNMIRAEAALKNIKEMYTKANILINLTPNPSAFDIRIHGATLGELAQGVGLCDCNSALVIGGWAPNPRHVKWGNALLVNPHSPSQTWKISDAHEFGHKLGLKHRQDLGLMDYAPVKTQDKRTFKPSDRQRIIDLYK